MFMTFINGVLSVIGLVLFKFYGWVVVTAIFGYLAWQNRRKKDWVTENSEDILLLIEVPKDNEKKELSAEQMFASLHGILRPAEELRREHMIQEHISFEISAKENSIQFFVWCLRSIAECSDQRGSR